MFLLGSIAGNMVLLQSTVMGFANEAAEHPDATPAEQAINVYKHTIKIEFYSVFVAMLFSFVFGYLYEVWSRRAVLILCFGLLGVFML